MEGFRYLVSQPALELNAIRVYCPLKLYQILAANEATRSCRFDFNVQVAMSFACRQFDCVTYKALLMEVTI